MNLHSGHFPACTHRRKTTLPSYHLANAHPSSVHSARSSLITENHNDSFLPSIVSMNVHQDGHRPFRRNDFANNHLFLAKKKLARIFADHPPRSLQATSDLIHLFDPQEPKKKSRAGLKPRRQESLVEPKSSSPAGPDFHLSVVNLALKPPYPHSPAREPLLTAGSRHHRPIPAVSSPMKTTRGSVDILQPTAKQQPPPPSTHLTNDTADSEGLIDQDDVSDTISTILNPFDTSLLSIKSIIPIHANPHVVQHR